MSVSPWIKYSLVRLGLFGASFGLLLAATFDWWWAAIIAAVVSMTVSYIFFSSLRGAVALDLPARRTQPAVDTDAVAEDGAAEDATPEDTTHRP